MIYRIATFQRSFKIVSWTMKLLLIAFVGLTAASAAPTTPPVIASLVGHWQMSSPAPDGSPVKVEITFEADGTFHGHLYVAGSRQWSFAGEWVVIGEWLHYEYLQSDAIQVPEGTKDVDKIISITDQRLVIENRTKKQNVYTRCSATC